MPIEDTLGALDELVQAGKVREIGCSNFSPEQLRAAEEATREGAARFVSVQNEYSLLHREPEYDVLPECVRARVAFIPYFPLANGLLTGKYRQGQNAPAGSRLHSRRGERLPTDRNLTTVEELIEFSQSRGAHDTGAGLLVAAHAAGCGIGDRWGYLLRAGEEQRDRCQLETE